jgi:hypothetical protein
MCRAREDEQASKNQVVLANRSAERILFEGMTVTGARYSQIVASLGSEATTTLDSPPVALDEALSADGEALWIEVDGLPSLPGGVIEATVNLRTTVIPVSLTVNYESKPSSKKSQEQSAFSPISLASHA